jgi:ATP synthase A chain
VAGCLEVISILFRPVSLSFRLYGNTYAGENMLETMATLVPSLSWLLPVPFYFLELLVGVGAGAGLHAVDGRLHASDVPTRDRKFNGEPRLNQSSARWSAP